jgi:hypothetical protein
MKTLKGTTGDYSRVTLAKEIGLLSVSEHTRTGCQQHIVGIREETLISITYQGRQREPGY